MKQKIIDIIEQEISEWNRLEEKIPNKDYENFELKDFDYLADYYEKYGQEFELTKFMDFCASRVLEELASSVQRRSIWYWEEFNEDFIIPQFKYLSSLIKSYLYLKDGKEYKVAFIVIRTFIEVSSQFYSCFLDFEFFKKYLSEGIQDEYRNHWFKHLKPEKVLSVLRRMNQDLRKEYKKDGEYTLGDLRAFIYPFESEQREMLYEILTSYAHGKHDVIISNLTRDKMNELNLRITEYIVSSINMLNIASNHFLDNTNCDTRKHVILQQVWHSIKYKN
ncbi:hypothetical protein [Fulvivirga sediminis]|uniref:Uncharacterized protein n=1 Tax=Fulvivirga sediminis TaxID=2803949 RepID=A0A937K3A6_9BACT|nr:hypothetical protein [Fulvivirga sediminis]MBL3658767.1 hypothetical protein [Fulvivirga sediminis]